MNKGIDSWHCASDIDRVDLIGAKTSVSRGPLGPPKAARPRHAKPATESRLIPTCQVCSSAPFPGSPQQPAHSPLTRAEQQPRVYVVRITLSPQFLLFLLLILACFLALHGTSDPPARSTYLREYPLKSDCHTPCRSLDLHTTDLIFAPAL